MQLQPDQVYAQLGPIVFGAVDSYGVDWSLETLDGWAATKPTLSLQQKPRQSGAWAGDSFSGPRSVTASGKIFAPDAGSLRDAIDRLNSAVSLAPTMLQVTEAGSTRWVNVQQSDDVIVQWLMPTIATWSIQVAATDWRKFGQTMTGSTGLPATYGGLTIPFTIPFTIDATTVSGQVNLFNPGNESGPVVLRIDGPYVGPVVTHVSTGDQLVFSSSLTAGAGEYLLIDMEKRTALANGQSSRAGYITSRGWSSFTPGSNTWAFTAASFDPNSLMTVSAVPSWR